jgi:hypothetical protein
MARFHRHLKTFGFAAIGCAGVLPSPSSHAEPLDTVIAPQLGVSFLNEDRRSSGNSYTKVNGYRYSLRADCASLSSNVSVNATAGFGGSYTDYGLQFRLFDLLQTGSQSASGLYYGAGFGFTYSPGFKLTDVHKTPFFDLLVTAFLRFQWDSSNTWGLFTEVAYEGVIKRTFNSTPALEDRSATHRFFAGLGVPFEVDL